MTGYGLLDLLDRFVALAMTAHAMDRFVALAMTTRRHCEAGRAVAIQIPLKQRAFFVLVGLLGYPIKAKIFVSSINKKLV